MTKKEQQKIRKRLKKVLGEGAQDNFKSTKEILNYALYILNWLLENEEEQGETGLIFEFENESKYLSIQSYPQAYFPKKAYSQQHMREFLYEVEVIKCKKKVFRKVKKFFTEVKSIRVEEQQENIFKIIFWD